MRDYGKVAPTFWTGSTGRGLRKAGRDAQVLALYLITSPHANMLGLYYLPIPFICHETGMSEEGASKGLLCLCEAQFAHYDLENEVVWVPEMARFQVGEQLKPGDKRVVGINREYASLPNNCFLRRFFDRYESAFHLESPRGTEAPSKPPRSQEQEQEQEQEHKDCVSANAETLVDFPAESSTPAAAQSDDVKNGAKRVQVPFQQIVDLYHAELPQLRKCEKLTDSRKGYIRQRWLQDLPALDDWRNYFRYVAQSPFLTGRVSGKEGRPPFVADLEWLSRPTNYVAVAEGKYHRNKTASAGVQR